MRYARGLRRKGRTPSGQRRATDQRRRKGELSVEDVGNLLLGPQCLLNDLATNDIPGQQDNPKRQIRSLLPQQRPLSPHARAHR